MRAPQAPLREGISGAAGVGKREIWAPQAKAREDWEGFEGDAGTPWNFWRRKREIWACGPKVRMLITLSNFEFLF